MARQKKTNPLPSGRPSIKTEELCNKICALLVEGYSLRTISKMEGMPDRGTVFLWCETDPAFAAKYARARLSQAEGGVDDMQEIADDSRNDYMEKEFRDGRVETVLNPEAIARSKLRLEQRRWYAEKLLPKKYGTKLAIGGDEDAPPVRVAHTFDVSGLSLEELEVLEKAVMKVIQK